MKYLLLIPHSIYIQWICWFGGKINGGKYYSLWEIQVNANKNISLTNVHIECIPYRDIGFRVRNIKHQNTIDVKNNICR